MLYNPPSGSIDPNAPYVGKNLAAGIQGSKVPRLAIEATQREIVGAIVQSGQNPTNDDLLQLWKAMRIAAAAAAPPETLVHYGVDTSTAAGSVIVPTVKPDAPSLSDGMLFEIVPAISNTGSASLKIGDLPARPIVKQNGVAVVAGDLRAGFPVLVILLGPSFRLLSKVDSDVLPFTPAGAKQNQIFSPGQQASDLNPPNADVVIQSLNLMGASYIDARGSMAFRNDTSSPLNVITYLRLVDVSNGAVLTTGPYLGGITKDGSQVPITVFGVFLGLNPAKTYQVQLMASKQSAIPCATLDYLIFTLHD